MEWRRLIGRAQVTAWGAIVAMSGLMARAGEDPQALRAGMIGLDTSHAVAFTQILNRQGNPAPLAGIRVVAAYPGGSPDLPSSWDRVEGYTKQLREEFGVEIVDSIPALLEKVDVVFLESVDGRPHLEQLRPVLEARKPVFIDKPVAASLSDTIEIFRLAREAGVPCFTSSSLRFSPNFLRFREGQDAEAGKIVGCDTYGPCSLEEHHPDLFWYGIHGVETLYTIMGTGCTSVSRAHSAGSDLVVGLWKDGRIGSYRGIREGKSEFGATIFGEKKVISTQGYAGYEPLIIEICRFFRSGSPPVSPEETIELVAFMEAADRSKELGGAPVPLADVLKQAEEELAKRSRPGR